MAKKRIHPESFRVGNTQNWDSSVKLNNYRLQIRLKRVLDFYFNTYFETLKQNRKFLIKNRCRSFRLKTQLRRRSIFLTNMIFSRSLKYPHYSPIHETSYDVIPYWYDRTVPVVLNQKLEQDDLKILHVEKQIQKRRIRLLYNILKMQRYMPYNLITNFFYLAHGIGGSTALRRYQFNLMQIQPQQWTLFLNLRRHSFKKMVGYITSSPSIKHYAGHFILLLSQINIALHWKNSYLFISVLKTAVEQTKRAPGFLRLFKATLVRLQINRYNITALFIMVTGSFGKMSRTRVLRIGSVPSLVSHSLTNISQPVSYSAEQAQTKRGALGLRVWLFWML